MGKKKKKKRQGWMPPQTIPERIVVKILNEGGFKTRENSRLHGYYPDIQVQGTTLLIEVDGLYHFTPEQQKKDETRTDNLRREGYTIIRFTNKQVKDAKFILDSVKEALCIPTEASPKKFESTETPATPHRRREFAPRRLLSM